MAKRGHDRRSIVIHRVNMDVSQKQLGAANKVSMDIGSLKNMQCLKYH